MATNEKIVAEKLLHIGAVKLQPKDPFTWASGWKSPIYCDNRRVLSFPFIRDFIKSELCNVIFQKFPDVELIAGVATAGIAWAALAADQLKLPMVYVRPKPKEHGLKNQVEGYFEPGQRTLLVEDLVSTGKSSLQVASALREEGLAIEGMVSIFNYGFEVAKKEFENEGVSCYSLTDYNTLVELALEKHIVSPELELLLKSWRIDPANWQPL